MRVKYSDISQTFFQFSFHVTVVFFFIIVEKILNTRVLLSYTCQGNCRSPPPVCVLFLAEFARWLPSVQSGLRRWGWKTQMLLQLQGHLSPQWNSSYFWILPKVSPRFPPGAGGKEPNKKRANPSDWVSQRDEASAALLTGSRGERGGGWIGVRGQTCVWSGETVLDVENPKVGLCCSSPLAHALGP